MNGKHLFEAQCLFDNIRDVFNAFILEYTLRFFEILHYDEPFQLRQKDLNRISQICLLLVQIGVKFDPKL